MCLALGWPHPDYLFECLTGEQLAGWLDYADREPFGFMIEDTRAAMTMTTIANSAGANTTTEDFTLADKLLEANDDDGSVADAALIEKLRSLLPPKPAAPAPPVEEQPTT